MIIKKIAKIKLERGKEEERLDKVFRESELIYSIDKERMFIGDGIIKGGILVSNRNYVVNTVKNLYDVPSNSYYGDIINDNSVNKTYIIGYDTDGKTLKMYLISDMDCLYKVAKRLDDLLNEILPLTACFEEPCDEPVVPPPKSLVWKTEPTSKTIAIGDNISLDAIADGTGTISYQWYKYNSVFYDAIAGATGEHLIINPIKNADLGRYISVATSTTSDSITSREAILDNHPSFIDGVYQINGGYIPETFVFSYKTSAFFDKSLLTQIQAMVVDPLKIVTTIINGNTLQYIDNQARLSFRSAGSFIFNYDGTFDSGKKKYLNDFTQNVFKDIIDVYIPSYGNNMAILLNNGDLLKFDNIFKAKDFQTYKPSVLAHNVDRILSKNKSHTSSDFVFATKNDEVFFSDINTFTMGISGISASEILFSCNGLSPNICTNASYNYRKKLGDRTGFVLCKKSELQKLYGVMVTPSNNTAIFPLPEYQLTGSEIYLDGAAGECGIFLVTNQHLLTRDYYEPSGIRDTPYDKKGKIAGHTSYTYLVLGEDNKYYLFPGTYGESSAKPALIYFNKLKPILDVIRGSP